MDAAAATEADTKQALPNRASNRALTVKSLQGGTVLSLLRVGG